MDIITKIKGVFHHFLNMDRSVKDAILCGRQTVKSLILRTGRLLAYTSTSARRNNPRRDARRFCNLLKWSTLATVITYDVLLDIITHIS